jgi:hypothetical protein
MRRELTFARVPLINILRYISYSYNSYESCI